MNLIPFGSSVAVGLDIGSKNIKVVSLKPSSKGKYKLSNWALLPLPDNVVLPEVSTELRNPAVLKVLNDFFSRNRSISKQVSVSISGPSVVIRYIKLPIMTRDELEKSIKIEAEPFIPFPINEVNLAFDLIGEVMDEGVKKNEVVIVAARKDVINMKIDLLKSARLSPKYIDVDVFALETAIRYNYDISKEVVCMINIGANLTNVSIIEENVTRVSRDLPLGMEYIFQSLKNLQQIEDKNVLQELLKTDGLLVTEQEKEQYLQQEKRESLLFSKNLSTVLKELVSEFHKIIDFYYFQKGEQKMISKIFISGGGTIIKNLNSFISDEFKIPVEYFDSLKSIEDGDLISDDLRPMFSVAVGLALKNFKI